MSKPVNRTWSKFRRLNWGLKMPAGRRGLVAPQNTFLDSIIRRSSQQRKSILIISIWIYCVNNFLQFHDFHTTLSFYIVSTTFWCYSFFPLRVQGDLLLHVRDLWREIYTRRSPWPRKDSVFSPPLLFRL
jgi:hypothetical protein